MKVLIMACGRGTRLWPLSTTQKPKQFINLGDKTLIERTKNRFSQVTQDKDIFYSILPNQISNLKSSLECSISDNQILYGKESAKENFINIVASVKQMIDIGIDKNESIVMTWSDIFIQNENLFHDYIKEGLDFIEDNKDKILLCGIRPDYPSVGFGYIEIDNCSSDNIFDIKSFLEKPDKQTANKYFISGNHLWNSGVFVFKLGTFYEECIKHIAGEDIPDIPVDKAVFERSANLSCLKMENIGWSDVGNFQAMHELSPKDSNHNYLQANGTGEIYSFDSTGNYIVSSKNNIVVKGMHDLVVIEKDNVISIFKKDDKAEIKSILGELPDKLK